MTLRAAALASLAVALVIAACGGGPNNELRVYVETMQEWFEEQDPYYAETLQALERDEFLLAQIDALDPPGEMVWTHNVLVATYKSLLIAIRREPLGGVSDSGQRLATSEAYVLAQLSWGHVLAEACDIDPIDAVRFDNGTSACLGRY